MKLVVDANVLVAASVGRSIELLIAFAASATELVVPLRMIVEAHQIANHRQEFHDTGAPARMERIAALVTVLDPRIYEHREPHARERLLPGKAQKDWPVLAAALALDAPVWSNDRHFRGVGVAVWATRNIRFFDKGGRRDDE